MPRRRYSKEQKAAVVGIAEVEGQSEAARVTGIPLTTINQWFNRSEYVGLRNEKREAVGEMFWAGIQVGLKAVIEGFSDGKLGEKAVALGVLYDKHALMTGGATERTESHDWKFNDHETVERASAVLVEELARRTDESAAVAAVGVASEAGAEAT